MGRKRNRSRGRSGNSGLSRRAVLGLILAGGAGIAGAQQTGAFSSVTGGRDFDVKTASDQNALLGIRARDPTGSDGEEVPLFTLTNRFTGPLTVTVEDVTVVSSSQLQLSTDDLTHSSLAIASGGTSDVTATLSCESSATADVEVDFTASTDNDSVTLSRTTTVTCEANTDPCAGGPRHVVSEKTKEDIDFDGVVVVSAKTHVSGSVSATRCVILEREANIKDDVSAGDTVTLGKKSTIDGKVDAGGDVSLDDESEIKDEVEADGNVTVGRKSKIEGDTTAGGDVSLDDEADIQASTTAGGSVSLDRKSKIKGEVHAGGSVSLDDEATIENSVCAGGSTSLARKATVKGDVTAGGSISVHPQATIHGDTNANTTCDAD